MTEAMDIVRRAIGNDAATLESELEKADAEIERLRAGIKTYLDGNYSTTKKNDKCKHGIYGFETCENCIDEYFMQLIS